MGFKTWLEGIETGRDFWENFFLNAWRLDKSRGGLAQALTGLDPKAITNSAAFQNLDSRQQSTILARLQQGNGTVEDLVNLASQGPGQPAI